MEKLEQLIFGDSKIFQNKPNLGGTHQMTISFLSPIILKTILWFINFEQEKELSLTIPFISYSAFSINQLTTYTRTHAHTNS